MGKGKDQPSTTETTHTIGEQEAMKGENTWPNSKQQGCDQCGSDAGSCTISHSACAHEESDVHTNTSIINGGDTRSRCRAPCSCIKPRVDGRWSWVVMVASLVMTVIVDGIAFSFGVLLPELLDTFDEGLTKTSVVGSVQSGFYLMAGPIASALAEKFGYRPIAMVGSVLTALGFVCAAFSPNIDVLIVTYGVMGGVGFSFIFLTSMVSTTVYFDKWRTIAVGIATCGSGIGIFVFPLLIRKVVDVFSWKECLLIEAGIVLIGIVLGMTFLPLNPDEPCNNRDPEQPAATTKKFKKTKTFKKAIVSVLNVELFKDPVFVIVLFMAITSTIGIIIPFIFTPEMAEHRGIDRGQAAFLVSIMGITNTIGRVVVGLATHKLLAHPLFVLSFGHVGGAVVTMCVSLYTSYVSLATFSALFGLVYAIDAALSTVILVRILGTEKLSGAFGLLCLFRGVASVSIGPLAGYLVNVTGNYNATFYLAGSALLLTGILSMVAWALVRRREKTLTITSKKTSDVETVVTQDSSSVYM